jgi:hypothetical protein
MRNPSVLSEQKLAERREKNTSFEDELKPRLRNENIGKRLKLSSQITR